MIYRPDFFNSPGNGETKFRNWLESVMRGQHWHTQIFEDRQRKGIPDMSGALQKTEVWLELKVAKKVHSVHDYLHLDHEVTAQQHRWLLDRHKAGSSLCGIVVAWRTTVEPYVSFVPITEWRGRLNRSILMGWTLMKTTAKLNWLASGEARVIQMVRGEFLPGWTGGTPSRPEGSLSELSPQRQP